MKSSNLTLLVSENYRNFAVSKHSQLNLSEIIRIGKFLKRFLPFSCSFQKTFVTLPSEIKRRMNGDQTERLSQTGECRNEGECCLLESASAFARGVLEEIKALAGTTSCKSVQLVRPKKWAQEQGCWFDDHSLFLVDHDDPRRTLMNSSMPTTSINGKGVCLSTS